MKSILAVPALAALLTACGPASPQPLTPGTASTPIAQASTAPSSKPLPVVTLDPFALDGTVREEWLPLLSGPAPTFGAVTLPATPKNVPPPPPASCDAFVRHPTQSKEACADKSVALALLDAAMALDDPKGRDAKLALLETCTAFDAGVVRSLRAELAPPECGDALAEPLLSKTPAAKDPVIPGAILHTLVGQALAARLMRSVGAPPKLDPPFTKDRVESFTKGPLKTWFTDQANAVEELSKMGAGLSYYGKGIAAVAAGTADLRLVEVVRGAPIPDEFKADPTVLNEYFSTLDQALDPRKLRGRDAALVGLKELAHAGIARDARTTAARGLLSELFGGRRVDALDALSLAPIPQPKGDAGAAKGGSFNARLAATLPIFYVGVLLDPNSVKEPGVLAALADRGVPVPFRVALKDAAIDDASRISYAHARLRMGFEYWRAADFDAAASLFVKVGKDKLSPDDRLALALALALRNGPDDVAALMQREGVMAPDFGRVGALDVVAADEGAGADRGRAAFDAAVITQLTLPFSGDPSQWTALAKRYAAAVALLVDEKEREEALKRQHGAEAVAKTLTQRPNG
jgi:hypothetical protein